MTKQASLLSPFEEVDLQLLHTPSGNVSNRQAVVLDPSGDAIEAGVVSSDYKLVKNSEVTQVASELLTTSGLGYEEHQTLRNGKKFRQRYLL